MAGDDVILPVEERRELIADVAIALAVLRQIARMENEADCPEQRQAKKENAESLERDRAKYSSRRAALD